MLDFVPNHTAPDHPWIHEHPDFYVGGTEADLEREPRNYMAADAPDGRRILAYGRDPYFAGWPDTLQLNYGNPALQEAMRGELLKVAKLCDGLRFFHHGQLGGWDRKIPIHLCRGPDQPNDSTIQEFYRQLLDFLSLPVVRNGSWQLLDCTAASDGNSTADDMIAFAWQVSDGARLLVVVNYAPQPAQGYVRLPFSDLGGQPIRLEGRLDTPGYEREGSRLLAEGLYVDLPPWGYHVFEMTFIPAPQSEV